MPYILRAAPHTLHPTPYTLLPTPCTLHPTAHTLYSEHHVGVGVQTTRERREQLSKRASAMRDALSAVVVVPTHARTTLRAVRTIRSILFAAEVLVGLATDTSVRFSRREEAVNVNKLTFTIRDVTPWAPRMPSVSWPCGMRRAPRACEDHFARRAHHPEHSGVRGGGAEARSGEAAIYCVNITISILYEYYIFIICR